jgi:hypothetical protein
MASLRAGISLRKSPALGCLRVLPSLELVEQPGSEICNHDSCKFVAVAAPPSLWFSPTVMRRINRYYFPPLFV